MGREVELKLEVQASALDEIARQPWLKEVSNGAPKCEKLYIYAAAGNFGTESPTRIQEMAPTLATANALYERRLAEAAKGDANDALWAIEAIRDYNPEPDLDKIKAKVLLINDAEDHANPPELGTVERAMKRVKHGRYVLIPAGPNTHGHFSHFYAELWKSYLVEFMKTLDPPLAAAAE